MEDKIKLEEGKKMYWRMRNSGAYSIKLEDGRWAIYITEGIYICSDGSKYYY